MELSDSDKDKIIAASRHITDAITKTTEQMAPHLMSQFRITGRHLNVAIARSAITLMVTCATSAAASEDASEDELADVALKLTPQLEAILYKAIGVEP